MGQGTSSRRLLSRSAIAKVELDQGGMLRLTFGALTMRVDAAVCAALWRTLGEALRAVGALDGQGAAGGAFGARPALGRVAGLP